jgi:hypothetical protein
VAALYDDGALAEQAGETQDDAWVSTDEQHVLAPRSERAFGGKGFVAAQSLAQALLHAAVPTDRHAMRAGIPGGDEAGPDSRFRGNDDGGDANVHVAGAVFA